MRAVVTGQVGLDKKPYLAEVAEIARRAGHDIHLAHVGDMMYHEAPDVGARRILDLPLGRLGSLRRAVFRDILASAEQHANLIVNTHATFRWRHGLFYAFDYDQMKALNADHYICLVDNIDAVHARLLRDGHRDHSLKDLMVWREEEVLATELVSQIVRGHGCFYIQARGHDGSTAEMLYRLLFQPRRKKAYLSFPMSHVGDSPDLLATIEAFRRQMKEYFICFDPGDLEEKLLGEMALKALEQGHRTLTLRGPGLPEIIGRGAEIEVEARELADIIGDIDGQIYARDFKLIDQSDMIVSLIPQLDGGGPGLSSGVERELQHAHEATKDVYVIWLPKAAPSPFVTETATRVFRSVGEAVEFFLAGEFVPTPKGGLFE